MYQPRQHIDTSGLVTVFKSIQVPWRSNASLAEISRFWQRFGYRDIESIDEALADPMLSDELGSGEYRPVGAMNPYATVKSMREKWYPSVNG